MGEILFHGGANSERGAVFTRLLLASQSRISGYIFSLTGCVTGTEEILQEVGVTLWKKFDDFEQGSNFNAWALSVARFSVMEWRRSARRLPLPVDDATLNVLADEAEEFFADADSLSETLQLCLKRLPERQSQLMREHYFDDRSVAEIATRWSRTRMAIYKLMRKTHAQLLACIHSHA